MKIENNYIKIKNGKKEIEIHNLILNNYLNLYAQSLLQLKEKDLYVCLIDCSHTQEISPEMTTMNYDFVFYNNTALSKQDTTENNVKTTYVYENLDNPSYVSPWYGQQIKKIGFGKYDENINNYIIYAILDVEPHKIIISEEKELIIERADTIETELNFLSQTETFPIHLSPVGAGYFDNQQREIAILTKVGKGYNPQTPFNLTPIENLNVTRTNNQIDIKGISVTEAANPMYPSDNIYPSSQNYPKSSQINWIFYEFSVYKFVNVSIGYIDTGRKYYETKNINKTGNLNLKIKYERK